MPTIAIAEASRTARVLVANIDDGCFCVHLDWVEAVYQRQDAPLHGAKDGDGRVRSFLIHRGQPALVVDLREAFGLADLLGLTDRAAFMVVRAGSFLLALQVDGCIGVRDLDLRTKVPVPSSLVHDGGLSVGHLVELDGKLHGLLEPNRILSGAFREKLQPVIEEAQGFRKRQEKIAALIETLRRAPTAAAIKSYGRLARRNARPRAAAATRTLLKAVQESEQSCSGIAERGDLAGDTLLRDLVGLGVRHETGEMQMDLPSGESAMIFFDAGRIADACVGDERGRGALKRILALRQGSYRFTPSDDPVQPQRISDATLWLLLETLEQRNEERRSRHR